MIEKYDFAEIEKKWQKKWKDADIFKTTEDERKILCSGNVPIPVRKITYGACAELFHR